MGIFARARSAVTSVTGKVVSGAALLSGASLAHADGDALSQAAATALNGASSTISSNGPLVIAVIGGIVVVGIVIQLLRKA